MAFQSVLPRQLTKLYTDTKNSCDIVAEPEKQESLPEINALHRKYRIQKDRLIAWGLEWSDNAPQGDIDESVARAGLTETVSSVLETIKEILEEAERMQNSRSKATSDLSSPKNILRPTEEAWAASDRARYEDLAKDLTNSIDTLYDLSRSRRVLRHASFSSAVTGRTLIEPKDPHIVFRGSWSNSETTLINPSTRATTGLSTFSSPPPVTLPPKLEASSLTLPEEEPPPYDSLGIPSASRLIGTYRQPHSSTNPWKTDGSKTLGLPVLVEYSTFDAAYSVTGVAPPLDRFEGLLTLLARFSADSQRLGTLNCLGYFEDSKQPRFGLVYELPNFVYSGPNDARKKPTELRPVTLLSLLQAASRLAQSGPSISPPLEDRFRLAFSLAQSFSKVRGENFVHKDVNSRNIILFQNGRFPNAINANKFSHYALRQPKIVSFDVFSEYNVEPKSSPALSIYRHPTDPQVSHESPHPYGPHFDMYGLSLILLEVGLWLPLADLFKSKYTLPDFKRRVEDIWIRKLAAKCGTTYMQVVRDCFSVADRIVVGAESLQIALQVYERMLVRLQRCCLLDEEEPTQNADFLFARPKALFGKNLDPSTAEAGLGYSTPLRAAKRQDPDNYYFEWEPRKQPRMSSHPDILAFQSSLQALSEAETPPASLIMQSPPAERDDAPNSEIQRPQFRNRNPGSVDSISSLYKERMHQAATVIQRAWRSRKDRLNFKDYKNKVTLIQTTWRQRRESRARRGTGENNQSSQPTQDYGYPTPAPESESLSEETVEDTLCVDSTLQIRVDEKIAKPRLRIHPGRFTPELTNEWHTSLLPRLERILERVLAESDETVSIDLVAIGETRETAKPSIFITCTSTSKVRAVLAKKFSFDRTALDLKVRKGKIRRSKLARSKRINAPHRSQRNDEGEDQAPLNPYHQQRPLCGASIGAYNGEQHLPPVSYGGVVLVDNEPYGMSVHHLLDAPSEDDESDFEDEIDPLETTRSSALPRGNTWLAGIGTGPAVSLSEDNRYSYEISDDEDLSDSEIGYDSRDFDYSDGEESGSDVDPVNAGDIEGVQPGDGEDFKITQPAIDDVDKDFFPDPEYRDEDHLDSHELGHIHASSGIRRWNRNGIVHEIDWALLKLKEDRIQPYNLIQGGKKFYKAGAVDSDMCPKLVEPVCRRNYQPEEDEYPRTVARTDELGALKVHCFGRTSGLKGGIVGDVLSSVRIYRRKTFSRSWHVEGGFGGKLGPDLLTYRSMKLTLHEVGGDSGAWVVDDMEGRVCGHVLAWCGRNRIAYICPMEVLLEDIKRTLGAKEVYLPGSDEAQAMEEARERQSALLIEGGGENINGLELPNLRELNLDERVSRSRLAVQDGRGMDFLRSAERQAVT